MLDQKLSFDEIERYSKHLILDQVGAIGQLVLKNSKVLIIGGGGLGCPCLIYLSAAGVGSLSVIDFDKVELSNLQRQILYNVDDIGKLKVDALEHKIEQFNPAINFKKYTSKLNEELAYQIFPHYDLIIDGSDNFATRGIVNKACVGLERPLITSSLGPDEGQMGVFYSKISSCYQCLYPKLPDDKVVPSCSRGGIIGALPGIMGTMLAMEGIKFLLGHVEESVGKMLFLNPWQWNMKRFNVPINKHCPICQHKVRTSVNTSSMVDHTSCDLTPTQVNQRLISDPDNYVLLDVRDNEEQRGQDINFKDVLKVQISLEQLAAKLPLLLSNNQYRNKNFLVYCQRGYRSRKAIGILRMAGISSLYQLKGGISYWFNSKVSQNP